MPLDALDRLLDEMGAAPHGGPAPADEDAPEWEAFAEDSGTLGIPRASMPQIKSEHRGAMVQYLKGRGITHTREDVAPLSLRPTQAEYSPAKVEKACGFVGASRPVLISADDHVLDGHHQWLSKRDDAPDVPIPAIRLHAPINQLLMEAARFPSSRVDKASAKATPPPAQTGAPQTSATPAAGGGRDELDALLDELAPSPRKPGRSAARPPRAPSPPTPAAPAPEAPRSLGGLREWVESRGFTVTSTTDGPHNRGSLHGRGLAVDVRTKDRTPEEVERLMEEAIRAGYRVRDERTRPPGQAVWTNEHLHIAEVGADDELDALLGDFSPAGGAAPPDEFDALLDEVAAGPAPDEGETVSVETALDRKTGRPLPLNDPRRDASQLPTQLSDEGRPAPLLGASPDGATHRLVDVPLPQGRSDWSEVSSGEASQQSYRAVAAARGIPADVAEEWITKNAERLNLYDLGDVTGERGARLSPVDVVGTRHYDPERRTLRVGADLPLVGELEEHFARSGRGRVTSQSEEFQERRALDSGRTPEEGEAPARLAHTSIGNPQTSKGEKILEHAGPVLETAGQGLDYASRPFTAASSGVWAGLREGPSAGLEEASHTFRTGETRERGKNMVGEALRQSDTLKAVNPHLGDVLGGAADVVADPANLVPVGAGLRVVRALVPKLEAATAGLRASMRVQRLGLEGAAREARAANLARMEERLAAVERVTEKLRTGGVRALDKSDRELLIDVVRRGEDAPPAPDRVRVEFKTPDGAEGHLDLDRATGDELPAPEPAASASPAPAAPISPRRAAAEAAASLVDRMPDRFNLEGLRRLAEDLEIEGDVSEAGRLRAFVEGAERRGARQPLTRGDVATLWESAGGDASDLPAAATRPGRASTAGGGGGPRPPSASATAGGAGVPPAAPAASPPPRLGRSLAGRVAGEVVAVLQLPKAIRASFDWSALGRQGLPQILARPGFIKKTLAEQARATVSADEAAEFARSITQRPDYELMRRSGLDLSTPTGRAEEPFASKYAKKIPGLAASDRAYSVALDSLRVQAWDLYSEDLARAFPRGVPDEAYRAAAELVNISTGRGVVPVLDRFEAGKKIVNFLNLPLFSPRNLAGKFNVISPRRVIANAMRPETRPVAKIQMREALRGLGSLAVTMGLLDLIPGVAVGFNPFRSDFGKVTVGRAHYDLTGGVGPSVRYLA